jgi:hypothetical protein
MWVPARRSRRPDASVQLRNAREHDGPKEINYNLPKKIKMIGPICSRRQVYCFHLLATGVAAAAAACDYAAGSFRFRSLRLRGRALGPYTHTHPHTHTLPCARVALSLLGAQR